ncbi:MAG: tripartite tricarboxylate transporter permease, partial [Pyramidobacter sp.]|nr:tripartite tricarboxylate transporter permease [Pyramidobacter sp.]
QLTIERSKFIVNEEALAAMKGKRSSLFDLVRHVRIYIVSGIIGIIVGIIPGAGANIASFLSYNEAKRVSNTPELFGHGSREGIAASEAGNNGVTGGALIPMLTLGIPGNAVTAILLGGLMIQGLLPGNDLFTVKANVTYPFIMGFFMANVFMLLLGLFCAGQFAKVVRVPSNFLAATILVLTVVGSFAINNSIVDVYIMLAFGLLGYLLKVLDFDSTPIVLGMILGPIAEKGLLQTIILKKGIVPGVMSMFSRPICLALMALTVLSLLTPAIQNWKAKKKAK